MDSQDKDKSTNWGGQRPGAGNKFKWNSGETKAVRIPVAIADEVLEAAKAIDAGKHLVPHDCVTQSSVTKTNDEAKYKAKLEALESANQKLLKEMAELKADLFKVHDHLQRVTRERDEYFERVSDIQLELDNLKDNRVTQSRIIGIDLEEFYDAAILKHPPRERKLISKPMQRFKALIAEALTRRGVPVR